MNYLEAILLGLVQGLSEFLPISSSGHLAVLQNVFNLQTAEEGHMFFDVLLHFGTLISIMIVYWKDIVYIVSDTVGLVRSSHDAFPEQHTERPGARMLLMLFFGTLPLFIILPFHDSLEQLYYKTGFIGAAYAYRKHQHVGVDLLVERLPAGARRAVHLITSALLVVINGYITVLSVQFIQSSWIKRMPITKLPSSVVNTALVIGFGLMTIYSLVIFIKDLKSGNKLDGEVDA